MGMRQLSILLVEDEREVGALLSDALTSEGHSIVIAMNGNEALGALIARSFDCILLDLGLPDMDGLHLIKAVREQSMTPIIVISARGMEHQKVEALDLGADDYLVKPVGHRELFARLRALERRSGPFGGEMDFGLAVIDLGNRRIRRDGTEFPLTPTEYALLEVLVSAHGRLVSHRKLLTAVWGGDATEQTHYLRIYMSKLRQKLEPIPAEPRMLCTEPGVGYRLSRCLDEGVHK
jgi:two-component system KDP operon response regulator KdpE